MINSLSISFFLQMLDQWKAWRITGRGTRYTGPVTPPPPLPVTLWTRAAGELLTVIRWSPCQEMTIRGRLCWTSVKSEISQQPQQLFHCDKCIATLWMLKVFLM